MRIKGLLQILKNQQDKDHKALCKDFRDTIWILNRLSDSLSQGKIQFKPWEEYLVYHLLKFSFNCSTISHLSDGSIIQTEVRNQKKQIADIPSIFIGVRSLIEAYFTIFYLHFDSKDVEQNTFRYYQYKLSGLYRRQGFDLMIPEAKSKFEAERREIEDIEIALNHNKYFNHLDPSKKKSLTKRKYAKELEWEELIEKRGVKNRQFLNAWKLFSNHAHSEYLGLIQFKDYIEKPIEIKEAVYTALTQSMMVTVLLISDLKENFKSAELVFNAIDNEVKEKIEFWIDITQNEK